MGDIEKREITSELSQSYLDYAMSVIVSRALPDVRDGLKPVHRRILWDMWNTGLTHSAKFRKSANVVGSTMGQYHPHGDTAIYDAMVRMTQDFSLRYPLIAGQGNFGNIDGDNAAAMRYCVSGDTLVATERGLEKIKDITNGGGDNEEKIDIKVLSKERQIHRASKWFDSGEHPTLKVITGRGYSIEGSYNHPLLTWRRDAGGAPRFAWKTMDKLVLGDVLVLDRTADLLWPEEELDLRPFYPQDLGPRVQRKILPARLNTSLAFILGALAAEGNVNKNKIEFCNSDPEFLELFRFHWGVVFPDCRLHYFERAPSSYGKKNYARFEVHSGHVIAFLRNLGLLPVLSAQKDIPATILRSPKGVAAAFLRAYFEGDGTITNSGRMTELSTCSVSEHLLANIQVLLLRFGITAAKRWDAHRHIHKLYVRGLDNYKIFSADINFAAPRKRGKLAEVIRHLFKTSSLSDYVPFLAPFVRSLPIPEGGRDLIMRHNFDRYSTLKTHGEAIATAISQTTNVDLMPMIETLLRDHCLFDPIESIASAGIQRVYSIKVESRCHSFIANGFVNHNTEARLARVSDEMLSDIEKETVDWMPNYDGARMEPKVLPAKLPNLLLNGTLGIAVGMATSIPPHNLIEISDAILHLAADSEATNDDLLKYVQGPDFPTGGVIFDKKAIREAYASGRGSVEVRAKTEVAERKKGQYDIVVTEIPYQVNKSELVKEIAELVQAKKVEGIKDLRDESDREGLRIVIELKNDVPAQRILNQLFKHTNLQKDFHFNMIALTKGIEPRLLSLKDVLTEYLAHRKEVVRKRTAFDLKKAEERAHILEGLAKALHSIDKIIATIKKSADRDAARANLMKNFKFTEVQANAILEMKLATLANLEREKIESELKEKQALIKELNLILKSPAKMLKVITDEVAELKKIYGDARRTQVVAAGITEIADEDLIPAEDAMITLSASGYVKRMPPDLFTAQHRGGKGLIGSEVGEEDFLTQFVRAHSHDDILFFTDRGRVFQTKVYEIPPASRTAKGRAIHNFLDLSTDETIEAIVTYGKEKKGSGFLVMVTANGVIKKTPLTDFANIRRNGIIAIKLAKGDRLKWVRRSSGKDQMILATEKGQSIRFKEAQVRSMGRAAAGIRAVKLRSGDHVAGFDLINEETAKDAQLFVVMANGFGKRTPLKEYKVQNRGGSGIRTANVTPKTGIVIAGRVIADEKELFALSAKGQVIRTDLESVRMTGRAAQGVRIMNVKDKDKLAAIVIV